MARPSRTRLDQPKSSARSSLRPQYDPEMFGRWSETVARFIGSARFIGWMTLFVVVWLLWNTLAPDDLRFDPFPFIFLTLLLSLQASYAAPLILLAQNRQDDRDRVQIEQDRQRAERNLADTEYLAREVVALRMALTDVSEQVVTRDVLRQELKALLEDLHARDAAVSPAPSGPAASV